MSDIQTRKNRLDAQDDEEPAKSALGETRGKEETNKLIVVPKAASDKRDRPFQDIGKLTGLLQLRKTHIHNILSSFLANAVSTDSQKDF